MRVAIVQPNYIPWKGYFDLIAGVDAFVLLDDVQYTRRDWRNRNRVKTADGVRWLTIPVRTRGGYHQRIDDVRLSDPTWAESHWGAIRQAYAAAPFWAACASEIEALYREAAGDLLLVEVCERFTRGLCAQLGIRTPITRSSEYGVEGAATSRLVALCRRLGATEYLSGPAARAYLDEDEFTRAGISVAWMDYSGYPPYPQLHGPFVHEVSVVDLILNTGPHAPRFMRPGARLEVPA
jgi:WbqC-like protein family